MILDNNRRAHINTELLHHKCLNLGICICRSVKILDASQAIDKTTSTKVICNKLIYQINLFVEEESETFTRSWSKSEPQRCDGNDTNILCYRYMSQCAHKDTLSVS